MPEVNSAGNGVSTFTLHELNTIATARKLDCLRKSSRPPIGTIVKSRRCASKNGIPIIIHFSGHLATQTGWIDLSFLTVLWHRTGDPFRPVGFELIEYE